MRQRVGLGLAAAMALTACAMGGGSPPARPKVDVADQVGAVDRQQIVGTWQCRDLNPYEGQPLQAINWTYAADGTFHSESRAGQETPLGEMIMTADGKWDVQGERLVTSDVTTEARSATGNAATDMLAGIGAQFVNTLTANEIGSGDVLELSRSKLVLRVTGIEDPPVISCTR